MSYILKWYKWACLHHASFNGHAAVVEALIRAGANVNAINELS